MINSFQAVVNQVNTCKFHLKLHFARVVLRLGRCHDATDPGFWIVSSIGGIVALVAKGLIILDSSQGILPVMAFRDWIGTFLKGAILPTVALYLIWEMVQGVKWLHNWALRTSFPAWYGEDEKPNENQNEQTQKSIAQEHPQGRRSRLHQ